MEAAVLPPPAITRDDEMTMAEQVQQQQSLFGVPALPGIPSERVQIGVPARPHTWCTATPRTFPSVRY